MKPTITEIRRKKSKDSLKLLNATIKTIDVLHKENKETPFMLKAIRILHQSKNCLWRKDWLKLRRHILSKIEKED